MSHLVVQTKPLLQEAERSFALKDWSGRLIEMSGLAILSCSLSFIYQAQKEQALVAWVTPKTTGFFPPDAWEWGIDWEALWVVRLSELQAMKRATDTLLRQGAFALVVLDISTEVCDVPLSLQTRWLGLCQKNQVALLCLRGGAGDITRPLHPTASRLRESHLGSLISLRLQTERQQKAADRWQLCARVVKDKRLGPFGFFEQICHAPTGLR